LVALALVGGGAWAWRALSPHRAGPGVEMARPTRGEFVVSLAVGGTLQSDDAVTVRTGEARGKLTMLVPDGAHVKVGDVFCRIEARDLQQSKEEAELRLKQAREEIDKTRESATQDYENDRRAVEQARKDLQLWEESNRVRVQQAQDQLTFDRAELERLRLEHERQRRMADKGYVPTAQADVARATYEAQQFKVQQSEKALELSRREIASELRQKQTAVEAAERKAEISRTRIEEQVTAAEKRAEMAARELEKLRLALRDTTVLAPAVGVVTVFTNYQGGERRPWREGDQVSSGMSLGTISGSENMSVTGRIAETDIASVWKGQPAEVEFEALPGRKFTGAVTAVSAVAREVGMSEDPKAAPNKRVFDVWVKVKQDRPGRLKPGLNAKVRLIVKRLPHALYVPLQAVFERGGKSLVYVPRDGGFAPREVEVGERSDVAVVIRAGLVPTQPLAMADPTRLQAKGAGKGQ
jgi:multidrug efflux pump subunit AcrA (membrane-fusion protein)